ncbi:MAG: hypothetical protein ABSD90_00565 [Methylocystis sp.]|jgi:hypothetical protein
MIDDMLVFGVSLEVAQSARSCRLLIKGGRGGTGELPKFNPGACRSVLAAMVSRLAAEAWDKADGPLPVL